MNRLNEASITCTICLDNINENGVVTVCGHHFHRDCCIQVIMNKADCPNCRMPFPDNWLQVSQTLPIPSVSQYLYNINERRRYWEQVENALEEPPIIGPMLPSHQRWYDMDILEIEESRPKLWTTKWISDRLVEMRIRFNIDLRITLDETDILKCENNGIQGIYPEW